MTLGLSLQCHDKTLEMLMMRYIELSRLISDALKLNLYKNVFGCRRMRSVKAQCNRHWQTVSRAPRGDGSTRLIADRTRQRVLCWWWPWTTTVRRMLSAARYTSAVSLRQQWASTWRTDATWSDPAPTTEIAHSLSEIIALNFKVYLVIELN